MAPNRSQVNL